MRRDFAYTAKSARGFYSVSLKVLDGNQHSIGKEMPISIPFLINSR